LNELPGNQGSIKFRREPGRLTQIFVSNFRVKNHSGGRDCKNRPPEIKFPDETTCCLSRRLIVDVRQSRNPERRRFLPFRL
jgi:hypothetical protein